MNEVDPVQRTIGKWGDSRLLPKAQWRRRATTNTFLVAIIAINAACAPPPSQQNGSALPASEQKRSAPLATIGDFQGVPIAYLVGTPSPGDLTPDAITIATGALVTSSWEETSSIIEGKTYSVLIVDPGSIETVDWDWISPYYRSGMLIAAINTPLRTLASAVREPDYVDYPLTDWPGEYYSLLGRAISGPPAAQTAIFEDPEYRPKGEDWIARMIQGVEHPADKPMITSVSEPGMSEYFYRMLGIELINLKRTVESDYQ